MDKTNVLRESGVAVLPVIQLSHAAPDADVEPLQFVIFHYGDKAHILSINVDIVDRWNGIAHLEFARQVEFAVHRFLVVARWYGLFVPNLATGAGFGDKSVAGGSGQLRHSLVDGRQFRVGTAHDTAAVVTAGGDSV